MKRKNVRLIKKQLVSFGRQVKNVNLYFEQ